MAQRTALFANKQPGGVLAIESMDITTGNRFFVDSGAAGASDAEGGGKSPDIPFATVDYAIGQCTASNGDVIYVCPGHSETITTTNTLTADVAGITIRGLGHGNTRPTFLIDGATTAEIAVSAADVRWENCIFKAGHSNVVHCFGVTATGFTVIGCEFLDNTTNEDFLDVIDCSSTTDNNADRLTVIGCYRKSADTDNDSFIEINADLDRLHLEDNTLFMGVAAEAVIGVATGKDITNVRIIGNKIHRLITSGNILADPDTTDANTGLIAFNIAGHADTATEVWAPATCAFRYIENYATAVVDASGYILPAVDS